MEKYFEIRYEFDVSTITLQAIFNKERKAKNNKKKATARGT